MGVFEQKFKVGDLVRRVEPSIWPNDFGVVGEEYTVLDIVEDTGSLVIFEGCKGASQSAFELVEQTWQPKVGDRVRFTDKCEEYWWFGPNTPHKEGVVTGPAPWTGIDGNDYQFDVEVSGEPYPAYVAAEHIEPLPVAAEAQPLRIVEGRYYKTRDGRKVGPMIRQPASFEWYDTNPKSGHGWYDNGLIWKSGETKHESDLIAEWVDEPAVAPAVAAAATASNDNAPAARFKVGDVVVATRDYADVTKGNRYTIIEVDADDEELPIRVKDDAGDGWWLDHDAFEIITPAAPSSTAGFTIPLVDEEQEPLTVTLSLDADDFHEELDEIIAKLKKIRKLQRQTGLAA